jgi:YD repeat-containing protein
VNRMETEAETQRGRGQEAIEELVAKTRQSLLLCLTFLFCVMSSPTWGETIPAEKLWGWPKGAGSPWGSSSCPAATYEFITKDEFGCTPIAEQCHPNRGQAGYSPFQGRANCAIYTADNRLAGGGGGWTVCPQGFTLDSGGATCSRPNNCSATQFRNDSGECVSLPPAIETGSTSEAKSCKRDDGLQVGKPIIPATGEKILDELDIVGSGPDALSLSRHYGSSRVVGPVTGSIAAGLGKPWSHNHATFLKQEGISGIAGSMARVLFGDGSVRGFNWDTSNNTWKPANSADTLTSNATGSQYKKVDDDSVWQFDAAGKLLTVTQRNGWVKTYTYGITGTSTGMLTAVTNRFGRSLSFQYNAAGQLSSVTAPDGRIVSYAYDGTAATARLTTVNYPGLAGGTAGKSYLYENAVYPQLLTGIIDENGSRLATYAYDSQGRGISTQYAGGAGVHSISYGTGGSATVTDPLGTQRTYNYGTEKGKLAVLGADKPSGTGNSSAATRVQDANGFITQETDFLGVNTMYTWDINRRLPLTTIRAAGLPEVQTSTTEWHASYRLPTLVTEAGKTTAYSYDGAGNLLSQTVTDTASSVSRISSWTYNAYGQMLTANGPRTDVNDITSFSYYSTSTDFTDPAVNVDPSFQAVSVLLHGDGANNSALMTDNAPSAKTVTVTGNAKISTAQSKFGGSSMAFDGDNDYLYVPSSPGNSFNFGVGDFTIEAWFYLSSAGSGYRNLVVIPWGSTYMSIRFGDGGFGGRLQFASVSTAFSTVYSSAHTQASLAGAWHHVAFTRSGGLSRVFLDGSLLTVRNEVYSGAAVTSWADSSNIASVAQAYVSHTGGAAWLGYIDDVRITKGVARYTASFTPPALAFPNTGPVVDPNAVGHTAGDLQSITNPVGHVTHFTQYDRAGRVRQMVDPNGVVIDTAYTTRGWTSSVTVTPPSGSARTTSYTYDNAGQMTGATLPDGTTLGYSYDAAHRLTGVTDAKGNTVTYTLDAMGNKVGEQVKDPSSNLQRSITRVYDALNRVQQVTGASN